MNYGENKTKLVVIVSESGWWLQVGKNRYMWYGFQHLHITLALLKGLAVRLRLQDQVYCSPVVSKFDSFLHFPLSFPLIPFPVDIPGPSPTTYPSESTTERSAVMRSYTIVLKISNFVCLLLWLQWPTRKNHVVQNLVISRGKVSGPHLLHIVLCWN